MYILSFQEKKKGTLAYCVKGLSFPFTDMSWRLVEWIEIARAQQVEKIFIYYMHLQQKTLRALKNYVK